MSYNRAKINEQLERELTQLGYKYQNYLMEWVHVRNIIEKELLPEVFDIHSKEIEKLRYENEKLRAEINKLSFKNNPVRDRRMIELYKHGLSLGKIAKEVGMSKWGVSKALRRLGVN